MIIKQRYYLCKREGCNGHNLCPNTDCYFTDDITLSKALENGYTEYYIPHNQRMAFVKYIDVDPPSKVRKFYIRSYPYEYSLSDIFSEDEEVDLYTITNSVAFKFEILLK
jgi:hypothetical protein